MLGVWTIPPVIVIGSLVQGLRLPLDPFRICVVSKALRIPEKELMGERTVEVSRRGLGLRG